ncbi:MAG: type III pantothenate kinase [Arenicellales bacterium]|nr:type III pantothenate kinase [Arenicellales bacterium]
MNLLVDLGNSRIKWALSSGQARSVEEPFGNEGSATDFGAWGDVTTPVRVIVCNSAGDDVVDPLQQWCDKAWGLKPTFLSAQRAQHGVRNCYQDPTTLGCDRWLALIAARDQRSGSLAVVDCGTAITVDALLADGQFLGGVISAGPQVATQALLKHASHLHGELKMYSGAFNSDTGSAVGNGALVFAAGGIDKVLSEFSAQLGDDFAVLMTGGWATTIAPLLTRAADIKPDLVLQGIEQVSREIP